jgi:programmed cell death 6-interacting protein
MHLPAALDALDKPIGLPPSLLRKAEEVRLEDGPHRIDVMFRDVQALAKSAKDILEQV